MDRDDIIRMTEQECRALFFREAYVLASSEREMYRGFKLGLKIGAAAEREACAVIAFNAKTYIEAANAIRARGRE